MIVHDPKPQKIDANDVAASLGTEGLRAKVEKLVAQAPIVGGVPHPQPVAEAADEPVILTPNDLLNFDAVNDPNTLLGKRWLCRGGSCLVVGQTGLGKSSFSMQAAMTWALGQPLFGIAPKRPLKSLIIQAENDMGDLAEMFKGVLKGTGFSEHHADLQSRLAFVSDTVHAGQAFHSWALSLIGKNEPDLVWLDPLFAYLGGSASDQGIVSTFLRNGLGAIAKETGVCWMVVHHTNKPPADPTLRNKAISGDYAYLGAGSAELANWSRASLILRELPDSVYELKAAKRGARAGLQDTQGDPATTIFLRHATGHIHWERDEGPENTRAEMDEIYVEDVLQRMSDGRMRNRREVRDLVMEVMGAKRSAVLTQGRPANRVFLIVLERARNPLHPGLFAVTSGRSSDVTPDEQSSDNSFGG